MATTPLRQAKLCRLFGHLAEERQVTSGRRSAEGTAKLKGDFNLGRSGATGNRCRQNKREVRKKAEAWCGRMGPERDQPIVDGDAELRGNSISRWSSGAMERGALRWGAGGAELIRRTA